MFPQTLRFKVGFYVAIALTLTMLLFTLFAIRDERDELLRAAVHHVTHISEVITKSMRFAMLQNQPDYVSRRSIGANPTPMAYAETYTGLQTGAVDGQDNPLPNVQNMKFYEVMSQTVMTSHLVAFDVLCMNLKAWNAMGAAKQRTFQTAANKALGWSVQEHLKRETELAEGFKRQGLDVYVPDVNAFRAYAQKVYLASDEAKSWAPGILDKIAAVK